MKKMSKKELDGITVKLKPFWKKYNKLYEEHFKKVRDLEEEMNKKVKPPVKLEFFYVDGECVGIGAENYEKRKVFPLLQDRNLED